MAGQGAEDDSRQILRVGAGELALWGGASALVLGLVAGGIWAATLLPAPPADPGSPDVIMLEFAEFATSPLEEAVEAPVGELSVAQAEVPDHALEEDLAAEPLPEDPEPEPEPVVEEQAVEEPAPLPPEVETPPVVPEVPEPPVVLPAPAAAEPLPEPAPPVVDNAPQTAERPQLRPRDLNRPRPAPQRQETPRPQQAPPPQQAQTQAAPPPAPQQAAAAAAPATQAGTQPSASEVSRWEQQVMRRLSSRLEYPRAARQSGAQGTVMMQFVINRAGQVTAMGMVASSGDASLDQAAAELIRRASPMPAPPEGLPEARLTLTVPIEYALR